MTKPIPSLTIVSVTGAQHYAQSSAYAIATSYLALKDKIPHLQCMLVSPEPPAELPHYIQHIPCKPFSYFEYNLFMIYGLGQLIETDFCLVVQNDGWVMNGDNWRNEFFEYDYIGAPVPALVEIQNNQFIRRFSPNFWFEHRDRIPENLYEWQNGGFSLRSKRLLNAPRELGLTLEVSAFDFFKKLPLSLEWDFEQHNIHHVEDIYLCATKRDIFSQHGIKIAPRKVAAQFSIERPIVHQVENVPLDSVLGCHFTSRCTLLGIKKVQLNMEIYSLDIFNQDLLLNLLLRTNHEFILSSEFNKMR